MRALAAAATELGLRAPSFQSPPRSQQLDRSIRRTDGRDCVVAVRVRGRPFAAVMADAIEGVIVCNELDAGAAAAARNELWGAMEALSVPAKPTRRTGPTTLAKALQDMPAAAKVPVAASAETATDTVGTDAVATDTAAMEPSAPAAA